MDKGILYSFMRTCGYGVISSVAKDGTPQGALVGIAVTIPSAAKAATFLARLWHG
jgi:hypothetical protein